MLPDARYAVPDHVDEVLTWSLEGVGRPGGRLTGAERVGVAAEARASLAGEPGPDVVLREELAEVAHAVAEAPADITPGWIDELEAAGLDRFSYVEAAGVVCRISVIDTVAFGVRAVPPALPEPVDGAPRGQPPEGAVRTRAWVPTVGPGHALSSLSASEEERQSMQRLSDVLYLEDVVPVRMVAKDGLVRSQIEVLAARTSYLNECYY